MKKATIFLAVLVLFSSCASILNGKYQKVIIHKPHDANVLINGDEPKMKNGKYKLERDGKAKNITLQEEGKKDNNYVVLQRYKSPYYIMSVIPFTLLFYPPFYDVGPKSRNYEKEFFFEEELKNYPVKNDSAKQVRILDVSADIKPEDLRYRNYGNYSNYSKGGDYVESSNKVEGIKYDNTVFSSVLNKILRKQGYIDTTAKILKGSYGNNIYLSAKIKGITYSIFYGNGTTSFKGRGIKCDLLIEWEAKDFYKSSIFKLTSEAQSDYFGYDIASGKNKKQTEAIDNAINDAVETGFIEFMNSKQIQKALHDNSNASEENDFELITINNKSKSVGDLSSAISSSVTVKRKKGHGSGFIISEDGYIVTNYHVVADAEDLKVITNDGEEYDVTVERISRSGDLALLKIDATGLVPFEIESSDKIQVAKEVYAIGTPTAEDLAQTISKGIISSVRKTEGFSKLIQTDASINAGNSGGALVDKDGKVLGVVSSKVSGIGVEGVAFGIPGFIVLEKLKIKFD